MTLTTSRDVISFCNNSTDTNYIYKEENFEISLNLSTVKSHSFGFAELEGMRFGVDLLPMLGEHFEGFLF